MDLSKKIEETNAAMAEAQQREEQIRLQKDLAQYLVAEIKQIAATVATHMTDTVRKVTVENLPDTIEVPSISEVVKELQTLQAGNTTLGELTRLVEQLIDVASQLPKAFPEIPAHPDSITITNQIDTREELTAIKEALASLQLSPVFDPKITVKPSDVKVVSDFTPLLKKFDEFTKTVMKKVDGKAPEVNLDGLIEAFGMFSAQIAESLDGIPKKIALPNQGPSFKDSQGGQARASVVDINGVNAVPVANPDGSLLGPNVGYALFDADDSQPTYIGVNTDADAATSDTDWTIYKFLYTVDGNTTSIRKKTGAWTNRASLF